jgi:hypothetical protein
MLRAVGAIEVTRRGEFDVYVSESQLHHDIPEAAERGLNIT